MTVRKISAYTMIHYNLPKQIIIDFLLFQNRGRGLEYIGGEHEISKRENYWHIALAIFVWISIRCFILTSYHLIRKHEVLISFHRTDSSLLWCKIILVFSFFLHTIVSRANCTSFVVDWNYRWRACWFQIEEILQTCPLSLEHYDRLYISFM